MQNIHDFSLQISMNVNELFYYGGENFVLCYFISTIAAETASIANVAYNALWYQMRREEQIIVEMTIRRSQKPCAIKGLGVFVCSLETYLMVFMGIH